MLEESQRWDEIHACGVSRELLAQFTMDITSPLLDETRDLIQRVGHLLCYHGQHALWQLVYLEYNHGNTYALGDETLFLSCEPTSGEIGYKGPPAH